MTIDDSWLIVMDICAVSAFLIYIHWDISNELRKIREKLSKLERRESGIE
jgi:hypothetical protein